MLLLLIAHGFATAGSRPDSVKLNIEARRIDADIRLSGKLDDPGWSLAQPVEIKYEVTPGDNTPAPQRTFVKIAYNSRYVYFGFDCKDTRPSEIRAHITDRDKCFDDAWVMVMLDPYGDYQRSYEIVANPYGIQGDLLLTANNEDASFDALWDSAGGRAPPAWFAQP